MRKKISLRVLMMWLVIVLIIALVVVAVRAGVVMIRHYAGAIRAKEDIVQVFNEGNYLRVLALSEDTLVFNPVDVQARAFAGIASYYLGLYGYEPEKKSEYFRNAIYHLRLAIALDDKFVYQAELHYILALSYSILDEHYANLSIQHFLQAKALGYQSVVLEEQLGQAYVRIGEHTLGVEHLLAATSQQRNSDFYILLAEAYALLGKFQEAEREFLKAIELTRDDNTRDRVDIQLAKIYYDMGRLEDAKELYHKLLRKYPDNAQAYFILGKIYEEQGRHAQAREHWMQALRLDPQNSEVYARLYG
ncbi:tetratricopeptide repeat protein [Entomospira entomophila]|uniref:Tetratricopeptide repeat protein n=1 Tax=Entomospira entomophila TaxID=2719988 RepID=A0A968GBE0_9SPIO|nr:tetratricopeptide repeat protein [Entomospira entomophilus]NIZ40523.1 tetratricopeptide repeat protein [Entomospira entomophilus]WDI36081.1 tetratricopeptide repeat protein [Entomospira entomophilus]